MTTAHSQHTIEAEGGSLEDAREQVRSRLPQGLSILSVEVISREKGLTIFGTAATIDEAYAKAQDDVPDGMEVVVKKVLVSPNREVVTVEALDEQSAKAQVENQKPGGKTIIEAIKLVASGRKGLFVIGKATPNRYEVKVLQQAVVTIGCFKGAKIIATVGVAPELTQQEMDVLHDLLAIFSSHKNDIGSDSELQREYVEWWHENQCIAPEIAEKLSILSESGSRVLNQKQASQLHWLLAPVAHLLKSSKPLPKDEIVTRLDFGLHVTRWSVGEMHILGTGHLTGEVLFEECYQALGAVLGR